MARKLIKREPQELEEIVKDSAKRVGLIIEKDKAALLLRLIFSGIANYFFLEPDFVVNVGFMQFKKNPDKDQLFSLNILRDKGEGVVNASTLWRYYKGELATEAELKQTLEGFMDELISYSQIQETKINNITNKLNRR